jgi:hypothetical protein
MPGDAPARPQPDRARCPSPGAWRTCRGAPVGGRVTSRWPRRISPSLSSRPYQPHCSLMASTSIRPRPFSVSSLGVHSRGCDTLTLQVFEPLARVEHAWGSCLRSLAWRT